MVKKNIGILAHVDAGKTTLSEHFLSTAGLLRNIGSVDEGSAVTDNLKVEQERGISVKSAGVSFDWKDQTINLIDTPGHVDFSAEVERVLRVLDGAIVVLSAVEGVQAHTFTLVDALLEMRIPIIFFINKLDRLGADFDAVLKDLNKEFSIKTIPVYYPENEGSLEVGLHHFFEKGNKSILFESIKEMIIESDDLLLIDFLDENFISLESLWEVTKKNIITQQMIPVLAGVAKTNLGVAYLLDAVIDFLPASKLSIHKELAALIYKVEHHGLFGKIAHVRIFQGQLKSKEMVFIPKLDSTIKIGVTKKMKLTKLVDVDVLEAGDIGVLTIGDEIQAGDILGDPSVIPPEKHLQKPVLTVQVKPKNPSDYNVLSKALKILENEDPNLDLQWYKIAQEFHLKIMGPMQSEILTYQLLHRFNIDVVFTSPTVIYKERPIKRAEGYVRYWMPKPCWAIMTFLIEPGEIGSGAVYESKVRQSDIHLKYQNEVKRTIPKALKQGLKGWEVTDLKITLIAGEDHQMHSNPGDFILATPMGVMRGLQLAGTALLEPIFSFTIKAPEEYLGKIASDLTRMRGQFANPSFEAGLMTLRGSVPVATSMNYSVKLSALTSGKGRLVVKFKGYQPCAEKDGVVREFKGVSPLDEAKWILHRRGAYKADER